MAAVLRRKGFLFQLASYRVAGNASGMAFSSAGGGATTVGVSGFTGEGVTTVPGRSCAAQISTGSKKSVITNRIMMTRPS